MLPPIKDWDDAFANMAYIPGSKTLPDRWAAKALAYRNRAHRIEHDIAYGHHPRERFDLVLPDTTPKGIMVFIHGGYWMLLDRSFWTHLAEGARAHGWAVCLPSYTLTPEARIGEITTQIGTCVNQVSHLVDGPIRICGHSAGGHLAARMACNDTPLSPAVLARVVHSVSISGVHDLRPLLHTAMNDTLHLDEDEALRESPALLRPATAAPLTTWVGEKERPEFIRQAQLMAQIWAGLDVATACIIEPDQDHFSVLDSLCDPGSSLIRCILGMT